MNVADIMTKDVKTGTPDDTFAQVAKAMRESRISSIIVMGDAGPAGIVTERDVVNLVAAGVDPTATRVGERMTTDLKTVTPKTDIAEAAGLMAEQGIRHLPVVERGKLVGILSIRDLTKWAIEEVTGGHELPDLERSQAALSASVDAKRRG
jgi:CBS domain-containing protein